MYYLFNDSGALINEFETVAEGLSQKDMFPESILLYYWNSQDAYEHGIEILAPEPQKREFIYWLKYVHDIREDEDGRQYDYTYLNYSAETLEIALEKLKSLKNETWLSNYDIPNYGIEERITITHKVKIP